MANGIIVLNPSSQDSKTSCAGPEAESAEGLGLKTGDDDVLKNHAGEAQA